MYTVQPSVQCSHGTYDDTYEAQLEVWDPGTRGKLRPDKINKRAKLSFIFMLLFVVKVRQKTHSLSLSLAWFYPTIEHERYKIKIVLPVSSLPVCQFKRVYVR